MKNLIFGSSTLLHALRRSKGISLRSLILGGTLTLVASTVSTPSLAQSDGEPSAPISSAVQSAEGIVGDVDSGRRAPVITFSTEVAADGSSAKILVDTQIINDEFKRYPIVVDFFVNGRLFSKQFRSLELPSPLGIDVPQEMATIPFNYAIVATLLHPNRQYVSVVQGAISTSNNSGTFSCTATETLEDGTTGVQISSIAAAAIAEDGSLDFTIKDIENSAKVELEVLASSSSTLRSTSGTVLIQKGSEDPISYEVSGTVVASGSVVSSLDVISSDTNLSLKCEQREVSIAAANLVGEAADHETSALAEVLNAGPGANAAANDEGYGPGPNGETNFIPLDKVGGVVEMN